MLRTSIVATILLTFALTASAKVVTVLAYQHVVNPSETENLDPHGEYWWKRAHWSAVFNCGHIGPRPIGEARFEVNQVGDGPRQLLEVFVDFEC